MKETITIHTMNVIYDDDKSPIFIPEEVDRDLPMRFTGVFDNILDMVGKLDYLSTLLFFHLCNRMDNHNTVSLTRHGKELFLEEVKLASKKTYSMSGVNKAIKALNDTFAVRRLSNATFEVNPLYANKHESLRRRKEKVLAFERWKFEKLFGPSVKPTNGFVVRPQPT